ncbi:hypothetical protein HaLaN_11670 [Haematococcus lacustris]|uniref:Uncharacterized protein n=1 Tax=Haematococcus lacustris TaxID=44745 RepID=A0A699Z0C0_HAELA|nr:hypothetical protein HaLaN_11670 [Haematococcus lacustris]
MPQKSRSEGVRPPSTSGGKLLLPSPCSSSVMAAAMRSSSASSLTPSWQPNSQFLEQTLVGSESLLSLPSPTRQDAAPAPSASALGPCPQLDRPGSVSHLGMLQLSDVQRVGGQSLTDDALRPLVKATNTSTAHASCQPPCSQPHSPTSPARVTADARLSQGRPSAHSLAAWQLNATPGKATSSTSSVPSATLPKRMAQGLVMSCSGQSGLLDASLCGVQQPSNAQAEQLQQGVLATVWPATSLASSSGANLKPLGHEVTRQQEPSPLNSPLAVAVSVLQHSFTAGVRYVSVAQLMDMQSQHLPEQGGNSQVIRHASTEQPCASSSSTSLVSPAGNKYPRKGSYVYWHTSVQLLHSLRADADLLPFDAGPCMCHHPGHVSRGRWTGDLTACRDALGGCWRRRSHPWSPPLPGMADGVRGGHGITRITN